jgi:hypothetical protein
MRTPRQSEAVFACGMAMQSCLAALAHQLAEAATLAVEARDAMKRNERNLAIGTMMPLEQILPECDTLARAVRTLQTWHNRMPSGAERAAKDGVK